MKLQHTVCAVFDVNSPYVFGDAFEATSTAVKELIEKQGGKYIATSFLPHEEDRLPHEKDRPSRIGMFFKVGAAFDCTIQQSGLKEVRPLSEKEWQRLQQLRR